MTIKTVTPAAAPAAAAPASTPAPSAASAPGREVSPSVPVTRPEPKKPTAWERPSLDEILGGREILRPEASEEESGGEEEQSAGDTGQATAGADGEQEQAAEGGEEDADDEQAVAPPPVPVPTPEEKRKELVAERLALATKKDRELRDREAKLKEREEQLRPLEERVKKHEEASRRAKLNPLELLKEHGLSFEDVQHFVLQGGKASPEQEAKFARDRELDELRNTVKELKDGVTVGQKAAFEAKQREVVTAHKTKIAEVAKAGGEKFELAAAHGTDAVELAYEAQDQHFRERMKEALDEGLSENAARQFALENMLPIEKALEGVEAYYEKQAELALTSKKLQARIASRSTQQAVPKAESGQSGPPRAAPKTLTRSHAAPPPPTRNPRKTDEDYRAEARALLKFQQSEE